MPSIRSASVDFPWSMCAMMQKFRICAGAVNVLSAKLLMGISWWGYVAAALRSFRISSRHLIDTIARGWTPLCSITWLLS
ncbi:hypothetical protein CIW49_24125 [Mycolicibacterium sp. P1-18]|nr:hypothetical protein CIW49_24125 [Mycolicibacterium sp. P1-18]